MIVNPGKFQTVLTDKKGKSKNPTEIMPDGKHIKSNDTVTLLGIEIDCKFNFDKHISKLCNKSASLWKAGTVLRFWREKSINIELHLCEFQLFALNWTFLSKYIFNKSWKYTKKILKITSQRFYFWRICFKRTESLFYKRTFYYEKRNI